MSDKAYKVNLEAKINPDFLSDLELRSLNLAAPVIQYKVEHDTLADCSMACRMFIRSHQLDAETDPAG